MYAPEEELYFPGNRSLCLFLGDTEVGVRKVYVSASTISETGRKACPSSGADEMKKGKGGVNVN